MRAITEGESILSKSPTTPKKKIKKDVSPKKEKKFKDPNAPHRPVNPFMLFLRQNRENKKIQHPDTPVPEITKLLAVDWMKLTDEDKKPYIEQAAKLKDKYHNDVAAYKASDAFKKFQQGIFLKKSKKGDKSKENAVGKEAEVPVKKKRGRPRKIRPGEEEDFTPTSTPKTKTVSKVVAKRGRPPLKNKKDSVQNQVPMTSNNIKIFTSEFLEHNKEKETELRKLRKLTMDFEEQNAILSKHVDNMKAAETKLTLEMTQMKERNEKVEQHLLRLKKEFVESFASLAIPGTKEYPTMETMEEYLDKLLTKMNQSKNAGSPNDPHQGIRDRIQDFVSKFAAVDAD